MLNEDAKSYYEITKTIYKIKAEIDTCWVWKEKNNVSTILVSGYHFSNLKIFLVSLNEGSASHVLERDLNQYNY